MELYHYLLIGLVAGVAILVIFNTLKKLYHRYTQVITVWDYQTGLHYRNGSLIKKLEPGRHCLWGPGHKVLIFENRISEMVIQGQEVITSDCATLKLTAVAQWKITNPEKYHMAAENSERALYTLIQFALRQVVGEITLDEIIEKKASFGEPMLKIVQSETGELGLELCKVDVRDVMLSGDLKNAYQGVLTSKKESLAKLEKARGEAAALRTMANGARLFENNPELLRLKYLETLKEAGSSGYGNTLVIGVPEELVNFAKKP